MGKTAGVRRHDDKKSSNETRHTMKYDIYLWGASVIEVSIQCFIKLWEQQNEEVHGKTEKQTQSQ